MVPAAFLSCRSPPPGHQRFMKAMTCCCVHLSLSKPPCVLEATGADFVAVGAAAFLVAMSVSHFVGMLQ
ncbi:hypothetical protein D3C72_1571330 [compost metagenome]